MLIGQLVNSQASVMEDHGNACWRITSLVNEQQ